MSRKILLLLTTLTAVTFLPLSAAGKPTGKSADVPKAFSLVNFWLVQGAWLPGDHPFGGQKQYYEFQVGNARTSGLSQLQLDIYLPQQSVQRVDLYPSDKSVVKTVERVRGNRVHWTLRRIGHNQGFDAKVNATVLPSAKGMICDQIYLTLPSGQRGNYSPPCAKVR